MFAARCAISVPDTGCRIGALLADHKLYVIYFLGATPYYYGKHIAAAEAIIKSATI